MPLESEFVDTLTCVVPFSSVIVLEVVPFSGTSICWLLTVTLVFVSELHAGVDEDSVVADSCVLADGSGDVVDSVTWSVAVLPSSLTTCSGSVAVITIARTVTNPSVIMTTKAAAIRKTKALRLVINDRTAAG